MPNGWTAVPDPKGWAAVTEPAGWKPVAHTQSGPSLDESVRHAQLRGLKEGAAQGASDLYAGTKEGLQGVYNMVRHPVDTAKALGGGLAAAAEAVPDVARNLMNPDARSATVRGFAKGGAAGAAGVDEKASFSEQVGQFLGGTVVPTLVTAGTVKGVRALRAPASVPLVAEANSGVELARVKSPQAIRIKAVNSTPVADTARVPYAAAEIVPEPPKPSPNAGGRLVRGSGAQPLESAIADALAETRAEPPPKAVTLPPAPELPPGYTPRTSAPEPAFQKQAARKAPRIVKVGETPTAPAELPESWKAFVTPDAEPTIKPTTAPMEGAPARPKMTAQEVAQTMRDAYGSQQAARMLGLDKEAVRRLAPGPSRKPLKVRMAELDADYNRLINDPRGAIDPALLRTLGLATAGGVAGSLAADDHPLAGGALGALGGAALANPLKTLKGIQEARMIGMLSGAALPKSMLGDAGAIATAALENQSLAPVTEALRLPTNTKAAIQGFKTGTPSGVGPVAKANVFGRAMGAFDAATKDVLQRAGLSEADAQRLLLQSPNALGNSRLGEAMRTPLGRAIMPFQTIPVNTVVEGVHSLNELAPKSGASMMRRALTAGAIGAGAASGHETENPLVLGLLAALAGPRALPFALGAGITAGPKVIERVGAGLPDASVKDLVNPLQPINKPALLRLIKQLNGG